MPQPVRPHTLTWRERLAAALTDTPQTTRALAERCAVPMWAAKLQLDVLWRARRARKSTLPRVRASGFASVGWSAPQTEPAQAWAA